MPTLNDVLGGSLAQAVQVQQIIDALKGTPNKGVPVALVSLNDANNYALTVQNDDPTNSRALSVLKADGTVLITADATGVTLGAPVNLQPGSLNGTQLADASITNAKLGPDVARTSLLVNGGFEIWQRGNGPFAANLTYGPDRWALSLVGTDAMSVSRDTANVDASSGAAAAVAFTLGTGAGGSNLQQKVEDNGQVRGRTLSFSVRVRCSTANAARIGIWDSVNSYRYSGFHSGGGTYETLTITAPIASSATGTVLAIGFGASCTAYVDNACLVVGSQPANYVPMHPADDLARCLRYYETIGTNTFFPLIGAWQAAGVAYYGTVFYKVPKAVAPVVTKNGTWTVSNSGQPTVLGGDVNGTVLTATATALGYAFFHCQTAGATLTIESNP